MKNKAAEQEGQDYYQELFNYMSGEHNVLLLESDMFEIVDIVKKILTPLQPSGTGELKCTCEFEFVSIGEERVKYPERDPYCPIHGEEGEKEVNKGAKTRKFERLMMPDKNFSSSVDKEERLNRLDEAVADLQELNATSADAPQIKASAGHRDSEDGGLSQKYINELHLELKNYRETIAQQEQIIKDLRQELIKRTPHDPI